MTLRGPGCDRRTALALGGVAAGLAVMPASATALARPAPVLTFFGDRPMVDPTGSLGQWRSPGGYRGGEGVAALDAEFLRSAGLLL